MITVY